MIRPRGRHQDGRRAEAALALLRLRVLRCIRPGARCSLSVTCAATPTLGSTIAATSPNDQVPTAGATTCAYHSKDSTSRCPGVRADGFEHCLAHLTPVQLDQALQRFQPGADLNASGVPINAELLARILQAVQGQAERPTFGRASFANANFTESAYFNNVWFTGDAEFYNVRFSRNAEFNHVMFTGDADFNDVKVTNKAYFQGAIFNGNALFFRSQFTSADFHLAQFTASAHFDDAIFTEKAGFFGVLVTHGVVFNGAQFMVDAYFDGARLAWASFAGAQFTKAAGFAQAQFTGETSFRRAEFRTATFLGPLAAESLTFDGAVFDRPLVIEATAAIVSCRATIWNAGVTLRLRYAAVQLDSASFTAPSSLSGSDQPFTAPSYAPPVTGQSVESHMQELVANRHGDSPDVWVPSLESLRGADAANLSVADVDLSRCGFAGARLLDQLRLEGRCVFDHTPTGIWTGLAWPPVWRWSRRQSLAEERSWRATTRKWAGWSDTRSEDAAQIEPERLAALYRQLRKAQEDAKNEPGAADFYYGEMEMRRHARSTPLAERHIVALYWAVSGYGLRATRSLVALSILVSGSAAASRSCSSAILAPTPSIQPRANATPT